MLMRTYWYCSACGVRGSVDHAKDADVYSVIERLRRAHERKADTVECGRNSAEIHVVLIDGRKRRAAKA
jgi:hypothetical protein